MTGGEGFHLDLKIAPSRVNIVELLVAALAQVAWRARVERLREAQQFCFKRELQAQVIQAAPLQTFVNRAVSAQGFAGRAYGDENH